MMRRTMIVACLGLPLPASPEPDQQEFYRRIEAFDRHYQAFVNRLCYWPESTKCRPDLGHTDNHEFLEARKAAMKLFELQEKK